VRAGTGGYAIIVAATFSQTTRVLVGDRPGGPLLASAAALSLIVAWGTWFTCADVTVHEVTEAGRVEVVQQSHDMDTPIGGRVIATRIALGLDVNEGDILVELDAETEKRKLAEENARLRAIEPELEARRRQLVAMGQSLASDRDTTTTALAQARARRDEADLAARQADEESKRTSTLHASGSVTELEMMRAKTEAARAQAAADAAALELERLGGAQRTRDVQGRSRSEELRSEMASLEGQKERARAAIDVLELEIVKRTIRAGVSGRLGEVSKIGVGQFVKEGERLASIVPSGQLRAVAEFAPESALGRVRIGQSARMRMRGFPWTQYGTVPAKVTNVANELHGGTIRVELAVSPAGSRIPLGHGMPGSVEVDVDRAPPLHLVLRAVGRAL
jgi:membrane fusion protein (multidrug efflux system)